MAATCSLAQLTPSALPLVSGVLVRGLGLWLCYDSLHP